jgi:signal transduction histidine kinase
VLIADNNDAAARHTVSLLRDAGYQAQVVPDASHVLEALRHEMVDVAVANADLSEQGGLHLLTDAGRACADLPVILHTASFNVDRAVEAMKAGARDYLTRPYAPARLLAAVASAVKSLEARAAARGLAHGRAAFGAQENGERRLQAQRQAAYGSLSAAALHELSNCLTFGMGYAELLRASVAAPNPAQPLGQHLGFIATSFERANNLLEQMKLLARKMPFCARDMDLNLVVNRVAELLKTVVRENVRISVTTSDSLGFVYADIGRMEQVLINLVLNARDAMPHGGHIYIRTDNVDLERPRGPVPPGSYVVLNVRDTGTGMSDDVKARMYEPYFSTKEPTDGAGLGLSALAEIIAAAGGHVLCDSNIGRGTEFLVYLPRIAAAPTLIGLKTVAGAGP